MKHLKRIFELVDNRDVLGEIEDILSNVSDMGGVIEIDQLWTSARKLGKFDQAGNLDAWTDLSDVKEFKNSKKIYRVKIEFNVHDYSFGKLSELMSEMNDVATKMNMISGEVKMDWDLSHERSYYDDYSPEQDIYKYIECYAYILIDSDEVKEGFMDIFKRKKPFTDEGLVDRVKETLVDLSDNGYIVDVEREDEEGLFNDVTPFIIITITKDAEVSSDKVFNVIDLKDPLQFTISYLKDEVGLELNDIVFREDKWTHTKSWFSGNQSGTKKRVRYTRLNQIKESDTAWYVEIRLNFSHLTFK